MIAAHPGRTMKELIILNPTLTMAEFRAAMTKMLRREMLTVTRELRLDSAGRLKLQDAYIVKEIIYVEPDYKRKPYGSYPKI